MRNGPDDGRDLLRDGTSASRADQAAEGNLGRRSFFASVALHAVLVVLIVVAGFVSFDKRRKNPLDELSEFTVAVPPDEPEPENPEEPEKPEEPPKPPEPEPEPEPEPAPVRDPIPVPATTKPKPTRQPIDTRNVKIVHKTVPTTTRRIVPLPSTRTPRTIRTTPTFSGPRLSAEDLQKLLDMGATISDHTSIPASELQRCYALIQKQLYDAWIRPSSASATGREPVIAISIGQGGVVLSASLKTGSGDAELDRSAVAAAKAVRRFAGLSEDFVHENPSFTVAFKLEGAL